MLGGQLRAGRRSVWECGLESGKAVAGWVAPPPTLPEKGSPGSGKQLAWLLEKQF